MANREVGEDIVNQLTDMIEEQTGKKIFTIRVLDKNDIDKIDVIVVFNDKSVLQGVISIIQDDEKLGCRIQGNYI